VIVVVLVKAEELKLNVVEEAVEEVAIAQEVVIVEEVIAGEEVVMQKNGRQSLSLDVLSKQEKSDHYKKFIFILLLLKKQKL